MNRLRILLLFISVFLVISLIAQWFGFDGFRKGAIEKEPDKPPAGRNLSKDPGIFRPSPIESAKTPQAIHFSHALGTEMGSFSYNAQPFSEENKSYSLRKHLGDDLNGIGGWNSDAGMPVYAVADGRVGYAGWASQGWGKMIILSHAIAEREITQTSYAHLGKIFVRVGERVKRGDVIGEVGSAGGRYLAHLHLECREFASLDPGVGYHYKLLGRRSPEDLVEANIPLVDALLRGALREPETFNLNIESLGEE